MPTIKIVPFPGAPGPRGDQGPRGYQGDQGIAGVNGTNGKSAYEIAVDNGFSGTEQEWLDYISSGAADLTVPVAIKDNNNNDFITFTKTGTDAARIATPQDDLSLRSARDITLYPGSNGPGNVYIGWGDAVYTPDSPNKVATIGDLPNLGYVTFDGVKVIGAGTASGDGNGYSTIEIVPDANRYSADQYLIVDPTQPNHIHIRAGGTQDASNAELIIGGEKANVKVVDYGHNVSVSTYNSDSDSYYGWTFGNDGTLYGPAEGAVQMSGVYSTGEMNIVSEGNMTIASNGGNMNFYMDGAAYIGPADSENRIAQIKDLNNRISPAMIRYQPTFAATGLTFTGSGTTYPTYNSYYTKAGNMVSFVIEVDCSTVTNFGTGQYTLELPFAPAIGYNHFSGWAQVDTNVNPDVTDGHVILNVDHAGITQTLDLHYLKQAGGAHTPIIEGLFLQGTPVTLTTSSKIYVNGTYIAA
jgi:hypothetical protein